MRKTILLSTILGACLGMVGPYLASADVDHEVVVANERPELLAASTADYLAWTAYSTRNDDQWINVLPTGGERFRVNPEGTYAFKPDIEGDLLVYGEWTDTTSVDIRFYDLSTRTFLDAPEGVNTDAREYWPSISGDMLMFARTDLENGDSDLILFDMAAGTSEIIASEHGWARYFLPGQVNGDFAVYSRFALTHDGSAFVQCDGYIHQISTGTDATIPHGDRRCVGAGAVDASGTVYYGAAGMQCGHNAHLMSLAPDGVKTSLVSFEPGIDMLSQHAFDNEDGTTTVLFDPCGCDLTGGDIWSVTV